MNKRKLQDFAVWAKINLEKQIELSLKKIGINSERDIRQSRVQGDITIIDGIESSYKKGFHAQREDIINKIKSDGYDHSIEQFASTWFNRIIALRFMEVHDYFDHGFKLFPSEPNTIPEILTKLPLVSDDLNLDMNYCSQLQASGNNNEVLYRYVLFQQCNALAKPLPMLFSSGLSYLEYFIPTPLLFGDTLINRLIEIDENDFKEDVEIIGWLYQFYVSNKKDEVFASKKTITKDTLPAVTQLFTPSWIVKYMAENSLGRLWLESYPNSNLKAMMKYYVEDAKQSNNVIDQLNNIKYRNINIEELEVIEPCSGSGHILTYLFDLFFQMYLEKGYSRKDIPGLIIKNNLFGLDIDQRATQLASFALAMKARSIDNKFFEYDRCVQPKVYEIIDSKQILQSEYNGKNYIEILKDYNENQWQGEYHLSDNELKEIEEIVSLFENAKVIGSLLKIKPNNYLLLRNKLFINLQENTRADIFTTGFINYEFKLILEILRLGSMLSLKYDVVITNPPYMATSSLEKESKEYFNKFYPESKTDMFAMFMESSLVKQKGFSAIINLQSWMFLSSYSKFRHSFLKSMTVLSQLHMGRGIFGIDFGSTSLVMRNAKILGYKTNFYRLHERLFKYIDLYDIQLLFQNTLKNPDYKVNFFDYYETKLVKKSYDTGAKILYVRSADDLLDIPSNSFAYWINDKTLEAFKNSPKMSDFIQPRQGLATTNNNKYLRYWFELNIERIKFDAISTFDAKESKFKWFPYNKGGEYRKWYGNFDYVVNYENDGFEIKKDVLEKYPYLKTPDFVVKNTDFYFKQCLTWPQIQSKGFNARFRPNGSIHDVSGMSAFSQDEILYYLLGILNTGVANEIFKMINPTINLQIGDFNIFPVYVSNEVQQDMIIKIVKENITLSKSDWDSSETSWDFQKHPLIAHGKLSNIFINHKQNKKRMFLHLKSNEEKLNEYFINLYGFQNEQSKSVDDLDISVSLAHETKDIKSLISYLIGVLMGRYSLVEDGLKYAGEKFNTSVYGNFDIDEDGIIPLFQDLSFENGLVHRIIQLIKNIYGIANYRENIEFMANAVGKKPNETSEETLNRYLNQEFYKDHLKTYQKRPIYWMFSSGKKNGFKALIYMHRYNSNTLAKMNASYFQPATSLLRTRIGEIEKQIFTATDKEKGQLERLRFSLIEQLNEAIEYGQVLDYMANKYISIDLDDGVKINYAKFQDIHISTNNGKVKKDLLVLLK